MYLSNKSIEFLVLKNSKVHIVRTYIHKYVHEKIVNHFRLLQENWTISCSITVFDTRICSL